MDKFKMRTYAYHLILLFLRKMLCRQWGEKLRKLKEGVQTTRSKAAFYKKKLNNPPGR